MKDTRDTFVIADTHFGHKNVIEYENRPFSSIEEMDNAMINNWNKVVGGDDIVYVLGDFSFYGIDKTSKILKQLNGVKKLVMGNHDRGRSAAWLRKAGFNEVYDTSIVLNEFLVLSHKPPEYFNAHTPYFYLYGHVHGTDMYENVTRNTACVCVERWNYAPVNISKLLTMAEKFDK